MNGGSHHYKPCFLKDCNKNFEIQKGISLWTSTSVQSCLYILFQNQSAIFCCTLFSENYLNPQVRINKTVNKHTVNYDPSPSQLNSSIHPLIFL